MPSGEAACKCVTGYRVIRNSNPCKLFKETGEWGNGTEEVQKPARAKGKEKELYRVDRKDRSQVIFYDRLIFIYRQECNVMDSKVSKMSLPLGA